MSNKYYQVMHGVDPDNCLSPIAICKTFKDAISVLAESMEAAAVLTVCEHEEYASLEIVNSGSYVVQGVLFDEPKEA